MAGPFDVFRYMSYMRSRWRWIAVSCTTATALAVGISLVLPREYTATARIVIEPPARTDLRAAVAVSPIWTVRRRYHGGGGRLGAGIRSRRTRLAAGWAGDRQHGRCWN